MKMPKMFHPKVSGSYAEGEIWKKVRPEESKEFILNPHKGMATFQHFNGDPLFPGFTWGEEGPLEFDFNKKVPKFTPGYLPSTVSYCRWFWADIEKKEGEFDFSMVENSLKMAEKRGQTLEVRLMPFGGAAPGYVLKPQPQLPLWYQKIAPVKKEAYDANVTMIVPEYDSPLYYQYWSRLIREFAKRFGKDLRLDSIDIALLGPWGEGAGNLADDKLQKFIDVYLDNIPAHKIISNGGGFVCKHNFENGGGWRIDCFGDMKNYGHNVVPNGLGYNSMYDGYPEQHAKLKYLESWKRAPTIFEVCEVWDWNYEQGMTMDMLDFVIEQGLKYHMSILMNKHSKVPGPWKKKLLKFCNDMGYKYVLRQLKYKRKLLDKKTFEFYAWIENTGVAPMYRDLYELAFRFTQGKKTVILRAKDDLTKWLPGDTWVEGKLEVPAGFSDGEIMMEMGIVKKGMDKPAVRFSNKCVSADGWVELDTVEVK